MTIEETVDRFIADFERDRAASRYIWWEAYDRALIDSTGSKATRGMAVAQTVLLGRRQQLEQFPDDPYWD
jgi:hypothetical protein